FCSTFSGPAHLKNCCAWRRLSVTIGQTGIFQSKVLLPRVSLRHVLPVSISLLEKLWDPHGAPDYGSASPPAAGVCLCVARNLAAVPHRQHPCRTTRGMSRIFMSR